MLCMKWALMFIFSCTTRVQRAPHREIRNRDIILRGASSTFAGGEQVQGGSTETESECSS